MYNYNWQPNNSYTICCLLLTLPSRLLEDSSMRRGNVTLRLEPYFCILSSKFPEAKLKATFQREILELGVL